MKEKPNLLFFIPTIIAALLPAAYVLYLISQAGHLLNFDYWWMIKNIYSIDGFSTNPFDWMFRANEHFVLIPAIIYALNIVVTKGSNIGLCLATFLLAAVQSFFLIQLLPEKITGQLSNSAILGLLIICVSIFNFTPAAAHNWMRGYSGVHWVGANLLVIAAIYCLTNLIKYGEKKWLIASIICGILGCMTYSTALALWPILCAAAILMGLPKRITLAYFGFAILVVGIYFITYKTPGHHPSLSKVNFFDSLAYIPVYLGAIFSHNIPVALIIGTVGLILAGGFLSYWLFANKRKYIDCLPWLSIIIYTFGTALMAAISRSGFGIEQAIASRYATLPALFYLSLIVLTIFWIQQQQLTPRKQKYLLAPVVAVVTVLSVLMYGVGGETGKAIAHRATYQPLVALSVQLDIADPKLIQEKVGNRPAAFLGLIDALKAHSLVPFNRDIKKDNFCTPIGEKIDASLLTNEPQENLSGYFDNVTKYSPTTARVSGWVGDNDKVKCLAILNENNIVRGFGMSGFPRLDVAELMGAEFELSGWKGYVEASPDDVLTAFVSLRNNRGWIALRERRSFN